MESSKPYSRAVRELLDAKEGSVPQNWDQENLSEAQSLAMVHISMAKAGNVQVGMMVVDRAEGKVPQAAEDRDAQIKAGTGIKLLAELLGLELVDVKDAEIVPQLTVHANQEGTCFSDSSETESLPQDSESLSDSSSTSLLPVVVDNNG